MARARETRRPVDPYAIDPEILRKLDSIEDKLERLRRACERLQRAFRSQRVR
jgi:hypothetical protein